MAQDIMSLAGGGYGLTDSFYNSGISNGPADCQKWSYCHSNERNSETINDFVNAADLNYLERYYSKLFPENDLLHSIALTSNRMSYFYVFYERNNSCADPNNFYINRGTFLLLEIVDVLDRTEYHAKLVDIVDFQRSAVK